MFSFLSFLFLRISEASEFSILVREAPNSMGMEGNDMGEGKGGKKLHVLGIEHHNKGLVEFLVVSNGKKETIILSSGLVGVGDEIKLSHIDVLLVPFSNHLASIFVHLEDTVNPKAFVCSRSDSIKVLVIRVQLPEGVVGRIIEKNGRVIEERLTFNARLFGASPVGGQVATLGLVEDIVPSRRLSEAVREVGVKVIRGGSDSVSDNHTILFEAIPEVVVHKVEIRGEDGGFVGGTVQKEPLISFGLVQEAKQPSVFGRVLFTWLKRVKLTHEIVGGNTRRVGVLDKKRIGGVGTSQQGGFKVGVLSRGGLKQRNTHLVGVGDHRGRARMLHIGEVVDIVMGRVSVQN